MSKAENVVTINLPTNNGRRMKVELPLPTPASTLGELFSPSVRDTQEMCRQILTAAQKNGAIIKAG